MGDCANLFRCLSTLRVPSNNQILKTFSKRLSLSKKNKFIFLKIKTIYKEGIYTRLTKFRHASSFGEVFATSGQMFIELNNFKAKLEKWIAPALVDLESCMEHHLSEPEDWEKAFQIAKRKNEELASLARYLFLNDLIASVAVYLDVLSVKLISTWK